MQVLVGPESIILLSQGSVSLSGKLYFLSEMMQPEDFELLM